MRNIQTLVQTLEYYIQAVPFAVRRMTEEELRRRPAPGKWSKIELIGHLVDSATYNWQRFVNIQFEDKPFVIISYKQVELVALNDYQNQPLEELLMLWQSLNRRICEVLKKLKPEQLEWKVIAYGDKEGTLAWWADDYTGHMEHHLQQILGSLDGLAEKDNWHLPLEKARRTLTAQTASPFIELMRHGSMTIEFYHPVGKDHQQPHTKDELYIIISGSAWFFHEGSRRKVGLGDLLFVPAGDVHRFEDFTEDFQTWVVFYGPEGGEKNDLPFETRKKVDGDEFLISTDNARLQTEAIHAYLKTSYWASGRTWEDVQKSLRHSMNFGLYLGDRQIGLARVLTDQTIRAYLCDVYVLEEFRSKGLGKWLLDTVFETPALKNVKNWLLFTSDAHTLYARYGFEMTKRREVIMERLGQ